jgi:hypothetical protein
LGPFPKWSFYVAFLTRAVATIGVGYYFIDMEQGGDTFRYFKSAVVFNQTHADGLIPYITALLGADIPEHATNWHSVFFIKIISPLVLLSKNHFWLAGLYLTLINFLMYWLALNIITRHWNRKWLFFLSFFGLPSVIIWSGGIFKEAIGNGFFVLAIAMVISSANKIDRQSFVYIILWLVISWFLINLRFYLAGVLFGFTMTWFWFKTHFSIRLQWVGFVLVLVGCFLGAQLLHPWLRPSRLPLTIYENYKLIISNASSNSSFFISTLRPTYWGLIVSAPVAWFTGFFRPLLIELPSIYWIPFSLEKLSLLVLTIVSLFHFKKEQPDRCLYIGLFWISVLGIALTLTTPNFGSLLRYQSASLPFLFMMVAWVPLRKLDATS